MDETGRHIALQKAISSMFRERLDHNAVYALFARRAPVLGTTPPSRSVCEAVHELVLQASPSWAMAAMKTWAHGWPTTSRLHAERRRKCVACTEGPDLMKHYFECQHFLQAIRANVTALPGYDDSYLTDFTCFSDPSLTKLAILVMAYHTYNMSKDGGASLEEAANVSARHTWQTASSSHKHMLKGWRPKAIAFTRMAIHNSCDQHLSIAGASIRPSVPQVGLSDGSGSAAQAV